MLSNRLLESEFLRVTATVKENMEAAHSLGLQLDLWTNVRNESVINFIITTPAPLFFKSLATEENRHTTIYLTKVVTQVKWFMVCVLTMPLT